MVRIAKLSLCCVSKENHLVSQIPSCLELVDDVLIFDRRLRSTTVEKPVKCSSYLMGGFFFRTNHKDERVVERTDLPDQLITKVTGDTALKEEGARVTCLFCILKSGLLRN